MLAGDFVLPPIYIGLGVSLAPVSLVLNTVIKVGCAIPARAPSSTDLGVMMPREMSMERILCRVLTPFPVCLESGSSRICISCPKLMPLT